MSPFFRVSLACLALLAALLASMLMAGCAPQAGATAGEVARFEGGDVRMVLTDAAGECPAPMKRFLSLARGTPFMGCWVLVGERVLMEPDGEPERGYFAPAKNFVWAPQA
jgi:hypothetical protein